MAKGSKGKRAADGISVGQPDTTARENAAVENDNITEDAIVDATAVAENVNAQEENAESETASEAVAAGATCEAAEEVAENVAEEEEQTQTAGSDAENDTMKPELSCKYVFYLLKKGFKRYFIDAFTGMAQGLFCTLIAGTILGQIGTWIQGAGTDAGIAVGGGVIAVANIAKMLMGAGIGIGIAHMLKAPKLVMFTAAVAGLIGAFGDAIVGGFTGGFVADGVTAVLAGVKPAAPGNPIGAYVVAVLAIEGGRLVAGRTKVDIVVVPLVMFVVCLFAVWVA